MVTDINYWSKVFKRLLNFAITTLALFLIIKLSVFYLPFLISFVLALLLEPIIKFIMKRLKWTRLISSVCVIVTTILIIFGLIGWGIGTLFSETNNLLSGSETYIEKARDIFNEITNNETLNNKLPEELKQSIKNAESDAISKVTSFISNILNNIKNIFTKLPNIFMLFFFTIISLFFMCTDKIYIIDQLEHHLPDEWMKKITKHIRKISKTIGNYLRAEATLIFISFIISLIGFIVLNFINIKIDYPLLASLGILFVDALPILGSGAVMVPWAILSAINKNFSLAVALLIIWAIIGITRNVLEPKLVSKHIGTHPVFTLIAMYTGYKLIGVIGMILGPILLIIIKEIYTPLIDKGILRSIFEK